MNVMKPLLFKKDFCTSFLCMQPYWSPAGSAADIDKRFRLSEKGYKLKCIFRSFFWQALEKKISWKLFQLPFTMLYTFWSITFQFLTGFECHSQITLQIILVLFPKISNSDNVPPLFLREKMQYFGNKMKPPALQIFAILNQIYEFWQISRRTNIDFITMTSSKVTAQKE